MKKFLIFIALSIVLSSCATHQRCDAYGSINAIEKSIEEKV